MQPCVLNTGLLVVCYSNGSTIQMSINQMVTVISGSQPLLRGPHVLPEHSLSALQRIKFINILRLKFVQVNGGRVG